MKITEEEKLRVVENSRIGFKGYTIPKDCLSSKTLEYLRENLFAKPFVNVRIGAPGEGGAGFACYRENERKIYIPRFYGTELFGEPKTTDLTVHQKDAHNLQFAKTLRDYQIQIVGTYTDYVRKSPKGGGAILEVPCGRGKCLGKDTPILMYDGTTKMVQDIEVGDLIMGDDSTSRTVLSLARGREMMYRVVPNKGDPYIVNESHILSLKYSSQVSQVLQVNKETPKGTVLDISVMDYLNLPTNHRETLVGYRVPVVFPKKKVDIDPYMLGYWLLSNDGIIDKTMPNDYKCNDRASQLSLLAGIIDADGAYSGGSYEITNCNERLLDDIIFVARSLGFAAYKRKYIKREGICFKTNIHGRGLDEIPVKYIDKNIVKSDKNVDDVLNTRIKLEKLEVDDYYGFEIDGNRRFVLGDFTVTHNTVMALDIISKLRQKTIVIVHKEFLMNQWIERIQEFLPGAQVGKIQGPVFDIEGKDIVIGMLQTLYAKDFGSKAFAPFGLTIIDEVHRIGSEQFSKALFKVMTPYMLGISATVERKDRLTNVLYMFIGERIYHEERSKDDKVTVRGIKFVTNDNDFNETDYDFRGNPKYSTMISKICNYGPRSDFIVRILSDLFVEYPDKQVMVLAHNRALLVYLYESIQHKGFASCGYYIGGMKQCDLDATEGKQIVLATYAMAAEALDIKSLSTLVMASPKTDITQSVGRILRVKGNNPIVIDVIDNHDHFGNQWNARKKYYKKNGYFIQSVSSKDYVNMTDSRWRVLYDPDKGGKKDDDGESMGCVLKF
jgi:superfamily II DNA or RNA helicase